MAPDISSAKSIREGIAWCGYDAVCRLDDRMDATDRGVEAQSKDCVVITIQFDI